MYKYTHTLVLQGESHECQPNHDEPNRCRPDQQPNHRRQPKASQAPGSQPPRSANLHRLSNFRHVPKRPGPKYKLTQCRISQIIRRVEKWLRATGPECSGVPGFERSSNPVDGNEESATDETAARQKLLQRLEFERLNSVCRLAMQHFQQPQKSITHKTGLRAGKPIDETTERTLPPNLQCLKVVLQANSQLSRLEKQRGTAVHDRANEDRRVGPVIAASAGPPTVPAEHGREHVEDWLTDQRDEAERAGLAPCSFGSRPLVRDLIDTLLGESKDGVALRMLASECGKKVLDRKPYDDHPPKLPPDVEGWHYPLYDYHGGLVAWLSADQLAGAVYPDYQPMRAPDPDAANPANPKPTPQANSTAPSSTSPPVHDSSQPITTPALTPSSVPTTFRPLTLNDSGLSGVIDGTHDCGVV